MSFIHNIVEEDIRSGKYKEIVTRFPPEPNGYLHLGHAKALRADFGIADKFNGKCYVRMDDTNPVNEKLEYVTKINEDLKWMGYDTSLFTYASDYFDKMIKCAFIFIENGMAYVDDQTAEEIKQTRGSIIEPGIDSPYRNRSKEENYDLFQNMINGKYLPGTRVLRAKINMSDSNPCLVPTKYEIQ